MIAPKVRRRLGTYLFYGLIAIALTAAGLTLRSEYRILQAEETVYQLRQLGADVSESYEVEEWWKTFTRAVGVSTSNRLFARTNWAVTIDASSAAGEALRVAAQHPYLTALDIRHAPDFDDDALAAVRGCTGVRELTLYRTGVTDRGLRHLKDWSQLQVVSIEECAVSDEGIRYLCGLPSMRLVTCSGLGLTDVRVSDLAFTGPVALGGRPLTISGRLCLKTPLSPGVTVELSSVVSNEDTSPSAYQGATSLVTSAAMSEATFSVTVRNTGLELQPGPVAVYVTVRLDLNPAVMYRLGPIRLTVKPDAP